ncbi:cell wall-associated NlpC family hydrolase [Lachnotalea glycerini]|uniref:Cell wall-associated NlpC family hydrolase n=1 Tax=Lachnotalea glycerini TaxID=1763509 RepID=A0A255IQT1_9FIRM|nr:SH3 domain-containing C40 family peptidase [Lachnotalea glycerini]PXV86696.1 cell wall-associated NlpC family hydrolase [Lachnotalea glycerini]RDY32195.1 hydrolase Nlp/P60 [Lachnotalea glycerini]
MDKIRVRIVTGCIVGTIFISGTTINVKATSMDTTLPTAGITLALNEKYQEDPVTADAQIKDFLEPSEYDNIAIAQVSYYVNMRSEPNEESEILGKIYNNSAATILETDGDWYLVKSGSVTGYIKAEYFITGDEAEALAKEVGTRIAKVNTTTLKVRDDASLDATVQTLVPIDEEMEVLEELDGWVKVKIDSDVVGFVSSDYVDLRTDFVEAESIEEEKARLEKEEAERKAAEEAARAADEAAKKKAQAQSKSSSKSSSQTSGSTQAVSGSRQAIVSYALQFVGNPYVYGGTSLTNGTDCSGFTQSVFGDNGISISRTSRDQGAGGREVALSDIQPGDLLFYSNGSSINHVALYIGNGQVVHASTEKTGIKISNAFYRTPCKAVSYVN